MVTKKIPMRMCVVCKNEFSKKELIRLVKTETGIILDKTGKLGGRGTYICSNEECKNKLLNQKLLNKVFKQNINSEIYDNLKEQFLGK